jgi:hypothetical protein
LKSVQIPKCPALNTVDFIITIFHANIPGDMLMTCLAL